MTSKYGYKHPNLAVTWSRLSDEDRARLGRNSQRFGNLTDVEREVVSASVLFSMGSKFIDPAYSTDEAVEEIVEYLD